MRAIVWACLLAWVSAGPASAQLGIAFYKQDTWELEDQNDFCGCDYILPTAIPRVSGVQFCSEYHRCLGDLGPFMCPACNGVCLNTLLFENADDRHVTFLALPGLVDFHFQNARQWTSQAHCTSRYGPIYGSITKIFAFTLDFHGGGGGSGATGGDGGSGATATRDRSAKEPLVGLPGDDSMDYNALWDDPLLWAVIYDSVPLADGDDSDRSWRAREGALAELIDRLGGWDAAGEYYQRALVISIWTYYDQIRPDGVSPAELGFPSDEPPFRVREQADEIRRATCQAVPWFSDCGLTPVQPTSWGTVKAIFR